MVFPILAAAAIAGIGFQAAGLATSVSASKKSAAAQKEITQGELKIEAQRMQAMELDAKRRQMEVFRQSQRARALSLTLATSQGAAQGSALAGAYGQASGQTGVNLLGITQNLEIGRNIFGLNQEIGQQKMKMADAQSKMAMGQGLSSLGGSIMSSAGQLNALGQGVGGGGGFGMGNAFTYNGGQGIGI